MKIVQEDGRATNADIARAVGMAQSATLTRLRKLCELGVIKGYRARIDPERIGLGLLAFVSVRTAEPAGSVRVAERLARVPNVLEVHHVAGEDCYLVKLRVRDPKALGALLRNELGAIEEVVSTRTTIVMETIKEDGSLPLHVEIEAGLE